MRYRDPKIKEKIEAELNFYSPATVELKEPELPKNKTGMKILYVVINKLLVNK